MSTDTNIIQKQSSAVLTRNLNAIQVPSVEDLVRVLSSSSREHSILLTFTELTTINASNLRGIVNNRSNRNIDRIHHLTTRTGSSSNSNVARSRRSHRDGGTMKVVNTPRVRNILVVETVEVGIQHNSLTSTNDSSVSSKLQVAAEGGDFNAGSAETTLVIGHCNNIDTRCGGFQSISGRAVVTPCISITVVALSIMRTCQRINDLGCKNSSVAIANHIVTGNGNFRSCRHIDRFLSRNSGNIATFDDSFCSNPV